MGNKPVKKYKKGACDLSVFKNTKEINNVKVDFYPSTVKKNYKDGEEWKSTNSFNDRELLDVLALILKKLTDSVKVEVNEDVDTDKSEETSE